MLDIDSGQKDIEEYWMITVPAVRKRKEKEEQKVDY